MICAHCLRQECPGVRLVVRADSGFCRPKALRRFEQWDVNQVVGLQKNGALEWRVALAELAVADAYREAGVKLLKIGAAIVPNTHRVRVLMASHHPLKQVVFAAAQALAP